jgi:hypothetical protein
MMPSLSPVQLAQPTPGSERRPELARVLVLLDAVVGFMSRPLFSRRRTTRRLALTASGSEAGRRV